MPFRKGGARLVAPIAMTLAFGCESSTSQPPPYTPYYPQQTYAPPYGQGYQPQRYGPQSYQPQPYPQQPYQPYPQQPYQPQPYQPQPYQPQPYPQQPYPQPATPGPQTPSPPMLGHRFPVHVLPSNPNPPSSPPNPTPSVPTSPTVPPPAAPSTGACVISDSAQTWKGSAKCTKGTGECQQSKSGDLVIQRTGPKSAMISTSGYKDASATFDPATCTVSHSHWAPKAPVAISINYSFVVSPDGSLSGNLDAHVNNALFGCTGSYTLSGTKK